MLTNTLIPFIQENCGEKKRQEEKEIRGSERDRERRKRERYDKERGKERDEKERR